MGVYIKGVGKEELIEILRYENVFDAIDVSEFIEVEEPDTEPQKICKYCNGKCSWWVDGDCMNDDCRFKPKTEPQTERSE